jgi:serine/threonine protein kinase
MAAAGTSGFATMQERGYFLLLDRLQCTLEHKIDHWRNFEKALSQDSSKKKRGFLAERLHVAFDVAAALSYLHNNHIIYRDLKPDNIGFDIRGMYVLESTKFSSIKSCGSSIETFHCFFTKAMSRFLILDWQKSWTQLFSMDVPSSTSFLAIQDHCDICPQKSPEVNLTILQRTCIRLDSFYGRFVHWIFPTMV